MRYRIIYKVIFVACMLLLGFYTYIVINDSNWYFGDVVFFINTIKNGTFTTTFKLIGDGSGRFYPLTCLEFGIFKNLGDVPMLYYSLQAFKCIIFFTILTLISKEILNNYISKNNQLYDHEERYQLAKILNLIVIFSLLPLMPIATIFLDIVYAEPMLVIWLALFVLFFLYAKRKDSVVFLILSALCGNFVLYYKETSFAILVVFGIMNLVFCEKDMGKKFKIYFVTLICSSIIWLVLYYYLVYIYVSEVVYGEVRAANNTYLTAFFHYYLKEFSIVFIFLVFGIYRFVLDFKTKFIHKKDIPAANLIFDTLIFSGLVYTFAFVVLKMQSDYYHSPAIVLFYMSTLYYLANYIINGTYNNLKQLVFKPLVIAIIIYVSLAYFGNSSMKRSIKQIVTVKNLQKHHIPFLKSVLQNNTNVNIVTYAPLLSPNGKSFKDLILNGNYSYLLAFAKLYSDSVKEEIRTDEFSKINALLVENSQKKYILLSPNGVNVKDELPEDIKVTPINTNEMGIHFNISLIGQFKDIYNDNY